MRLEQHHIKYEEIDDIDEIVLVTPAEHKRIHKELKANGAKPVPRQIIEAAFRRSEKGRILNKASCAKYRKTKKGKVAQKAGRAKYKKSEKGKAAEIKYEQSEKGRLARAKAKARYRAKQKELMV